VREKQLGEHQRSLIPGRDKTYVIDKQRAPLVREVFDRYLAGDSLTSLARELNDRGIRGSHGGIWSRARLKSMHTQPARTALRRERFGIAKEWQTSVRNAATAFPLRPNPQVTGR